MSPLEFAPGSVAERQSPTRVRRRPFYVDSHGQPLFAWLHHPESSACLNHGVLLCAPLGYEQVHAHRSWRVLASALAAAGFPVLRFDYHGTGDSAGVDEDPDRLATWLANIRDAKAWLQETFGCSKVSMIGLRLGATLAMQTAANEEIDSLLLWAPVVSGRHYVREMKALHLTASVKAPPLPEAPNDIEPAGFVLTQRTAEDLSKLDLLKVQPRCRRALIVTRGGGPQDSRLLDHLRGFGIDAAQVAQPGYADMMAEPHFTKVPHQAIGAIVEWLRAGEPAPSELEPRIGALPLTETWSQAPIRECVLTLRQEPNLFGVLTEPTTDTGKRPLILLLNGGSAYRVGPNRLYVLLARHLAAQGFRSVRLDLSGLGDSVPPGCDGENDTYAANSFRDIEFALDSLSGANGVVLLGLCSGAYFAFQSAVQIADPRLRESVLINPLTLFWKDGMTLETSPTKQHQELNYYLGAALKPSNWLKLLTGRTKTGVGGAIKKAGEWWRLRGSRARHRGADVAGAIVSHPLRDDLSADLDTLTQRGRPLACFFSKADPGYGIMTFHASRKLRELCDAGTLHMAFFDDADHTFSFRLPRRALLASVSEYLARRYPT